MIYLEIKGRLGNQFFRYAFARRLQIERGNKDSLVLGFSNMKGKNAEEGWRDSLCDFNVQPYTTTNKRLVYSVGSLWQKFLDTLYFIDMRIFARNIRAKRITHARKWIGLLNKNGLIHNVEEYYDYPITKVENVIIDGGFQCSKYLNPIREVIVKEFTPKHDLLPENKELYDVIKSTNSVCISIRRGDFIKSEFVKTYNICKAEYYIAAVDVIKSKVKDPVLVVFSDEVEWAKQNLDFGIKTYYERGCDPLWEKVRLMAACKHFIISNSSFSWMVQYLGEAPDKIVVSPDKWYNGKEYPNYLVEESFLKIKV